MGRITVRGCFADFRMCFVRMGCSWVVFCWMGLNFERLGVEFGCFFYIWLWERYFFMGLYSVMKLWNNFFKYYIGQLDVYNVA